MAIESRFLEEENNKTYGLLAFFELNRIPARNEKHVFIADVVHLLLKEQHKALWIRAHLVNLLKDLSCEVILLQRRFFVYVEARDSLFHFLISEII